MAEAAAATVHEPLDPRLFRDVAGRFATGIAVVTTVTPDGAKIGVTVNSFNTVSLDPPLVLFSLRNEATCYAAFTAAASYGVNILAADQVDVSRAFARFAEDGWALTPHHLGPLGCPVFDGALAVFECVPWRIYEGGDHVIMVGRVVRASAPRGGEPLMYYCGAYHNAIVKA